MPIERKLAAIMFTDIVGFTKIMGDDEKTALTILEKQQSLLNPIIQERKGTIIKKMGDGLLIEFPSTVEAVECATQIQAQIKLYNEDNNNIEFHIRIGIHLGDIVVLGDDILGDGVNIASRIEPLASSDGICITDAVYKSVKSRLKLDAKRIDEVDLKHIDDKYTIYKMPIEENNEFEEHSNLEEKHPKIKILSMETISQPLKEILPTFWSTFKVALVMHPFLNIVTKALGDKPFFEDLHIFPTSLDSGWALLFNFSDGGLLGFLIFYLPLMCLFMMICYFKKEEKVIFSDIRNVDKILDYMITDLDNIPLNRYEIIEQKGNSILYWPTLKSFLRILDKPIIFVAKEAESILLRFDGNVVYIRSRWSAINKLKKQLKLLELV